MLFWKDALCLRILHRWMEVPCLWMASTIKSTSEAHSSHPMERRQDRYPVEVPILLVCVPKWRSSTHSSEITLPDLMEVHWTYRRHKESSVEHSTWHPTPFSQFSSWGIWRRDLLWSKIWKNGWLGHWCVVKISTSFCGHLSFYIMTTVLLPKEGRFSLTLDAEFPFWNHVLNATCW